MSVLSNHRIGWIITLKRCVIPNRRTWDSSLVWDFSSNKFIILRDFSQMFSVCNFRQEFLEHSSSKLSSSLSPFNVPFSGVEKFVQDLKETMSIEEMLTSEHKCLRQIGLTLSKT